MNAATRICVALAVAVGVTAAAYVADDTDDVPLAAAAGPGLVTVVVDIEHSVFEPSSLRVMEGTEVRFVLRNGDPINHELIVGPPAVHRRHQGGTEAVHAPRPGELSVGPDGQGVTSYVFEEPGVVEMACHLPGHYEFGMRGEIEVVAETAA